MSTTDLYTLNGKSVRHRVEFNNGWGSAPILWDYVSEVHMGGEGWEKHNIFDAIPNADIPVNIRALLMMTLDRAYVPLRSLETFGQYCLEFYELSSQRYPDRVNHWGGIGEHFIAAHHEKFHRAARGIVISFTSVDDPWYFADTSVVTNAWSIFAEE